MLAEPTPPTPEHIEQHALAASAYSIARQVAEGSGGAITFAEAWEGLLTLPNEYLPHLYTPEGWGKVGGVLASCLGSDAPFPVPVRH